MNQSPLESPCCIIQIQLIRSLGENLQVSLDNTITINIRSIFWNKIHDTYYIMPYSNDVLSAVFRKCYYDILSGQIWFHTILNINCWIFGNINSFFIACINTCSFKVVCCSRAKKIKWFAACFLIKLCDPLRQRQTTLINKHIQCLYQYFIQQFCFGEHGQSHKRLLSKIIIFVARGDKGSW